MYFLPLSSQSLGFLVFSLGVSCAAIFNIYTHFLKIDPYMDEIFHIPQAQLYCKGEFFTWDPKITTFPGLYLYSSIFPSMLQSLSSRQVFESAASSGDELCTSSYLRLTVLMLAVAIPVVAMKCRQSLFPATEDGVLVGVLVFSYPLSFFYYFLYYTDTLSTLTLVLCTWLSAANINHMKTLTGLRLVVSQLLLMVSASLAIMSRQTNAVWLLHVAGTGMLRILEDKQLFSDVSLSDVSVSTPLMFLSALMRALPTLLLASWPLLVPVLAFVVFVFGFNEGGIVVGDKDNHRMVLHAAMPLHLLPAISLLIGPGDFMACAWQLATEARTLLQSESIPILQKTKRFFSAALVLCSVTAVLQWGCLPHPFLEADNRHLSFYVWRYVLSKPLARLCLGPVYTLCLFVVSRRLSEARGAVWLLIYLVAVCITLLPAHLFEFRYFTPGAVIALLNMPPIKSSSSFVWSWVTSSAASLALMYIFLFRPFIWPDGSTARFML